VKKPVGDSRLGDRKQSRGVEPTVDRRFILAPQRGIPAKTLLDSGRIPIETLADLALREGQSTSPLFRVHRWFARRLGSQFRAILTGLTLGENGEGRFWERYFDDIPLQDTIVLDPFVGGGTILVEAARCGARIIGFDIDPVATAITRFELAAPNLDGIPEGVRSVCEEVSSLVSPLHRTTLPDGKEAEVLHHFWVETGKCPRCRTEFEIHPHFQLAYDRNKKIQWVFCRECHEVRELPIRRKKFECGCGEATAIHEGTLRDGKVVCPGCGDAHPLVSLKGRAGNDGRWRLFAQEYLERTQKEIVRKFKRATDEDRKIYLRADGRLWDLEAAHPGLIPERKIPAVGRSDYRPLIHGFHRYRDLFNRRQLLHLALLGQAIARVGDEKARQVLGMAFSEHLATNCMYAAYAFGYRRLSPLFAVHAYRHITRPVEVNPWVFGARGTFPNAVNKIRKAIAYAKAPTDLHPDGGRGPTGKSALPAGPVGRDPRGVFAGKVRKAVKTHSSISLTGIPDCSVDLVLTDPPYFDNISYSELSDFYLAWHQILGAAEAPYDDPERSAPMRENLSVNGKQPDAVEQYGKDLSVIFRELRRVLKPEGLCVFTYHHKSPEAWAALGEALAGSGLVCTNVVPMRGEGQGGLHSYEGTLKWDAVFVCRPAPKRGTRAAGAARVTSVDIAEAKKCGRDWANRLRKNPRLGFSPHDELNLARAVLASRARIAKNEDGSRLILVRALAEDWMTPCGRAGKKNMSR
jgi:putative DNA methylase